jgi:lipopolysaccharide/colanic/teichoic acid biosynthesis glycosyltransferase
MIRFFDFIISIILSALFLPFLFPIVVLKTLFDGVPVFYNSMRIGMNGDPILVYKFRTMVNDSDAITSYIESKNTKGFERIPVDAPIYTKFGRLFERFQFVELPQLLNVVLGQMSLVGYRPLPKKLIDDLCKEFGKDVIDLRHSRLPGLTGVAQLLGRNNISNLERVNIEISMNSFFEKNLSISDKINLYFLILFETLLFILLKKNFLISNILSRLDLNTSKKLQQYNL